MSVTFFRSGLGDVFLYTFCALVCFRRDVEKVANPSMGFLFGGGEMDYGAIVEGVGWGFFRISEPTIR